MADPNAQLTRFPWVLSEEGGPEGKGVKGYLSMPLGTFRYLFPNGLPDGSEGDYTTEYEQTAKTYQRALYYGGPTVTVTRRPKVVKRTRSMVAMSARSERKLILSESSAFGSSQSTIHYTGPTYGVVAWLKQNASRVGSGSIQIRGGKGQTFAAIDPAAE